MTAKETVKTNKPIGTQAPKSGKLQRLGFIPQIGQSGLDVASSLYSYTKSWVPKQLQPTVEQGEQFYSKHGQPIIGSFANLGNEILLLVDGKVDVVVSKGVSIVKQGVDYSRVDKLGKSFVSARDTVTKQFKDATAAVQNKGISGSLQTVRERAFAVVDEAVNIGKRGLGIAQERSQVVLDIASKKGQQAHDTVVKQPLYKRAYDSSNNLIAIAQDNSLYKETSKKVYPYVAPIADPALEKIQPYISQTVDYWKPVSAAA
jgi:hypothetical protein